MGEIMKSNFWTHVLKMLICLSVLTWCLAFLYQYNWHLLGMGIKTPRPAAFGSFRMRNLGWGEFRLPSSILSWRVGSWPCSTNFPSPVSLELRTPQIQFCWRTTHLIGRNFNLGNKFTLQWDSYGHWAFSLNTSNSETCDEVLGWFWFVYGKEPREFARYTHCC